MPFTKKQSTGLLNWFERYAIRNDTVALRSCSFMILAGDIGGTKTNVALFETNGSLVGAVIRQQTFPSGGFDSLEAILKKIIGATELKIATACFCLAAPGVEGRARTPKLNWTVRSARHCRP